MGDGQPVGQKLEFNSLLSQLQATRHTDRDAKALRVSNDVLSRTFQMPPQGGFFLSTHIQPGHIYLAIQNRVCSEGRFHVAAGKSRRGQKPTSFWWRTARIVMASGSMR